MAWVKRANTVTASWAEVWFAIKDALVAVGGWTVAASGTGSAGTWANGDTWTSAAVLANNCWVVLEHAATGRQICVQWVSTNAGRVKYSEFQGFTGTGSASATQVPFALDEVIFKGGGTDAAPTSVTLWLTGGAGVGTMQFVADTETGSFCFVGSPNSPTTGWGLPCAGWWLDVLLDASPDDPCPVIFQAQGTSTPAPWTAGSTLTSASGSGPQQGRMADGTVQPVPALQLGESTTQRVPGNTIIDLYDGLARAYPVHWGRESFAFASAGRKGRSSLFLWHTMAGRTTTASDSYGQIVDVDGVQYLLVQSLLVRWPGTADVPTDPASEFNGGNRVVSGLLRNTTLQQSTAGNTPARVAALIGSGYALDFDGVDDFILGPTINAQDLAALGGAAEWTVEAIVRPDAFTAVEHAILTIGGGITDVSSASNFQICCFLTNAGKMAHFAESGAGVNRYTYQVAGASLVAGTIYRLAWVKRGANYEFWINGVLQDAVAYPAAPDGGSSAYWIVGDNASSGGTAPFDGVIQEIYVSRRALTAAEILSRATAAASTGEFPFLTEDSWECFHIGRFADATLADTGGPAGEAGGGAPTARFSFALDGLELTLTDGSVAGWSALASWAWDFGDGNNSTTQSPVHTYAAAGDYTVQLTVTDADGATDTFSATIAVGGTADAVAPTVTLISPADRNVYRNSTIVVDVEDETGLSIVAVIAVFPSGGMDVVHTGFRFGPHYQSATRETLDGGLRYRFTLARDGGWPERPRLEFLVRDAGGNVATVVLP